MNRLNELTAKSFLFLGVLGVLTFSSCKKTEFGNPVAIENVSKKPNKPTPPPLDRFELPIPTDSTKTETPSGTSTETPTSNTVFDPSCECYVTTTGGTTGTNTETPTGTNTETEGGETSCPTAEYPIYAGAGGNDINKGTQVGKVTYSNDGTNLYVKATFDGPTCPTEIHLWAGENMATVNGNGGLPFGQFPYKEDNASCGTYNFTIPLSSIFSTDACNKPVYIVLHAAMGGIQTEEGTTEGQTAIAYGDQTLGGSRWGWAADYNICCE